MNNRFWSISIIGCFVLVFADLNLALSAREGTLAMPPIYDDVGYLLDAYQRLSFGNVNSLLALIKSFWANPPHAPMSTLMAMIGFALFGPNVWGPYIVNAWIVAVYAAGIFAIARSNLTNLPSILLVALMLFVPIIHFAMTEFRPDMAAGLLFGLAIYLLTSTRYESASRKNLIVVGLVSAAAIVAKPTTFMITIPMVGLAALIGVFRPWHYSSEARRQSTRSAAFPFGLAMVLLVPFAIVLGPPAVRYAYQVLIVDRDIWATPSDPFLSWTFHSIGVGGQIGLKYFFPLGFVAIVIDVVLSARHWRRLDEYNALAFYLLIAILYCCMSVSTQQTIFVGSFFFFPFLFATTLALSRVLAGMTDALPAASTMVAGLLLAAAILFMPMASIHNQARAFRDANRLLAEISGAVSADIAANHSCQKAPPIFATIAPYPITPETLSLSLAFKNGIRVEPRQLFLIRSLDEMLAAARSADFVLVPNKWGIAIQPNLPGIAYVNQTKAALESDPSWKAVPVSGADAPILFLRKVC
jgi:hypothetical protein